MTRTEALRWVGTLVAGRYTLVDLLGVGGHGAVFSATEAKGDAAVAVKLVPVSVTTTSRRERLLREAKAAGRVEHAALLRVHAVGYDEVLEAAYLVRARVEGESLRAWLDEVMVLSPSEALAVMVPVAEALAACHAEGVVHRDLKPENVLLEGESRAPKLIDFGLADVEDEAPLTRDGQRAGTPGFMAPERVAGARGGPPSDVWSLAVMLQEAVTGTHPFGGEAPGSERATYALPPRLSVVVPGVSEALAQAVSEALAWEASARPSMGQWAASLRQCPEAAAVALTVMAKAAPRRSRAAWWALAVLGVGALGAVGFRARSTSQRVAPTVATTPTVTVPQRPAAVPVLAVPAVPDTRPLETPAVVRPRVVRASVTRPARTVRLGVNDAPVLIPP